MNSHILFIIFFTLSVIHPVDIPNINLYIAMGLFSLIGIIFIMTLYKDQTWKKLLKKYKLEILAILLFLLINIMSTAINYDTFNHDSNFFRFSLTSIAVWLLFPMTWVIYSENNNSKYQWIGWSIILILGLIALWQLIDIKSAYQLVQYSIGGYFPASVGYITSFTHLPNEYAIISAIAILALTNLILNNTNRKFYPKNIFYIFLIILLFITGLLTGSRIFPFIFLFIGIIYFVKYITIKPLLSFISFLILIFIINIFITLNPNKMHKYSHIFPYLKKINTEQSFLPSDFIPQLNNKSLNGRKRIWQSGINKWQQSKWLGIGTGGFRATGYYDQYKRTVNNINLHNYYLQVLVETGIIGLSSLFWLVFLLIRKSIQSGTQLILISICSSLLFDNLLDYSAVWVITISWLLIVARDKKQVASVK